MASPRDFLGGQRGSWMEMRVQRSSDWLREVTLTRTVSVSSWLVWKYWLLDCEGVTTALVW